MGIGTGRDDDGAGRLIGKSRVGARHRSAILGGKFGSRSLVYIHDVFEFHTRLPHKIAGVDFADAAGAEQSHFSHHVLRRQSPSC